MEVILCFLYMFVTSPYFCICIFMTAFIAASITLLLHRRYTVAHTKYYGVHIVIDFAISYSLCCKFSSSHCREQMRFTHLWGLITCNTNTNLSADCVFHTTRITFYLILKITSYVYHTYLHLDNVDNKTI